MRIRTSALYYATALAAALTMGGCGSSSSPAATTTTTTDTTSVSNAVPSDVVLASPTASTTGSANIAAGKGYKGGGGGGGTPPAGDTSGDDSYEGKKAKLDALRAGDGDCGFTPSLTIPTPPKCYGPAVNYTNHPGGSPADGQLPVRDVGFWSISEGTEACAAAQLKFLINSVSTRVDTMINMFNNMVCVGKKNNLELPAIGAPAVDFKSALGTKGGLTAITVNTATIERLANDSDGNPVYKSTVSITMTTPGGDHTVAAILKHIKTGDSTYKGKLSMTMSNNAAVKMGGGDNCGSSSGSVHAGVVSYVKSSATSVVYEMNFAEFCGGTATPLDSNNNISRTDVYNASSNPNGWGNDWNYALFNLNPANGTGTVAYAWQAGAMDGRTRTLNATVSETADGSASGTAYYGYGPGVNGTGTLGSIQGFICDWAGPGGKVNTVGMEGDSSHDTLVGLGIEKNKVQKQILSRAVGGTEFTTTADNSKITYAPDNSCNKVSGNSSFTFVAVEAMGPGSGTPLDQTNNISTAATVDNNLVDVTDITTNFTLPTAPADVGS